MVKDDDWKNPFCVEDTHKKNAKVMKRNNPSFVWVI
jgi:hypothetical protein